MGSEQQNTQTPARRATTAGAWLFILLFVLILDVWFVVLSWVGAPPYGSPVRTLLGGYHASYSQPRAKAVFDGERVRWLWEDVEAAPTPWPADWDHFGDAIAIPGTSASGILLPFRVVWRHRTNVFVPQTYGGDETESRLLRELSEKLRSDPVLARRMPSWYWEKLATEPGETVTYNFWLLAHDILFLVTLSAIAWLFLKLVAACRQCWISPRPGVCSKCRYDLAGLKTDRCPECGTPL